MLVNDLRVQFMEALSGIYPPQEINTFFYWLTQEYLNLTRLQVALAADKIVNPDQVQQFEDATRRLQGQEPIQYIVGRTNFYGFDIKVNKHVLIPRPETEELVEWILSEIPQPLEDQLKILDIGTGSGCIAIAIAKHLTQAKVTAIDVSKDALAVASQNAKDNQVGINFFEYDVLSGGRLLDQFDIIVSNPPYVRNIEKEHMQANVVDNEPGLALWVDDNNPLIFYQKITDLASNSLSRNGCLFFEINEAFGEATAELVNKAGFRTKLRKDFAGKDRMIKAKFEERS